jgi:hypothetical protein
MICTKYNAFIFKHFAYFLPPILKLTAALCCVAVISAAVVVCGEW